MREFTALRFSKPSLFVVVLLLLLFIVPTTGIANPIYVYQEPDGVIRFSNRPPPENTKAEVFSPGKNSFTRYSSLGQGRRFAPRLFPDRYKDIIEQNSRRYGVDADLIRAVIHAESAFNPRAVSPKGALGLMQIMPFNLKRFGITDPFVPEQNIRGGVLFLSMLKERYRGNLRFMLAAYNAGEGAVTRFGGVPPYPETQQYVTRVLDLYQRYKSQSLRSTPG